MFRMSPQRLLDSPRNTAPVVEPKTNSEQKTSSLIANLKQFAPSIDLVSGRYAGSVIGPELLIEGRLDGTGLIEIYGTIEGDVRGAAVTIAESGVVNGSIEAKILMVAGRVTGDLKASEVELAPTARVDGNIHHRTIIMAKGARFEGCARRMSPLQAPVKAPVAKPSAASEGDTNLVRFGEPRRTSNTVQQTEAPLRAAS